jgi:uncharacterized membrane protein
MSFLSNPIGYRWMMPAIMGVIYFLACLHRISPTVIAREVYPQVFTVYILSMLLSFGLILFLSIPKSKLDEVR